MENKFSPDSYSAVIRDIGLGVRGLVRSEVDLVKAELKETTRDLGKHAAMVGVFGALLSLSILPFLAFLVVGLGLILNENYWLSALIVSVVCAVVGGTFTVLAYRRIRERDVSLPHSRDALSREAATVGDKLREINGSVRHRRAV